MAEVHAVEGPDRHAAAGPVGVTSGSELTFIAA